MQKLVGGKFANFHTVAYYTIAMWKYFSLHIFGKNFVKVTCLLVKLINSWSDGIFSDDTNFLAFLHWNNISKILWYKRYTYVHLAEVIKRIHGKLWLFFISGVNFATKSINLLLLSENSSYFCPFILILTWQSELNSRKPIMVSQKNEH